MILEVRNVSGSQILLFLGGFYRRIKNLCGQLSQDSKAKWLQYIFTASDAFWAGHKPHYGVHGHDIDKVLD